MWRAHSFFFPTPRRLRRPNHPNLFLLGFSSRQREGRAGQRVITLLGTSTGPEENLLRYRAYRGCYSPHGCGEAGERLGSLCAIEVEKLKRRPPTEVGGLGLRA